MYGCDETDGFIRFVRTNRIPITGYNQMSEYRYDRWEANKTFVLVPQELVNDQQRTQLMYVQVPGVPGTWYRRISCLPVCSCL
jgi:hypothetical protein